MSELSFGTRPVTLVVTLALLFAGAPSDAAGQSGENVLVVAHGGRPDSLRIAEHYARGREISADQIVRLELPPDVGDEIARRDFDQLIQNPLANWLTRHAAQDRILFIVLTRGVPLRITGTTGRNGTVASVDSELTLLYRRMTGEWVSPVGFVENPYFQGERPVGQMRPFTHRDHDTYLVTRLDGFTADDAMALADRGRTPSTEGRFVLDMKVSRRDSGNAWLREAANRLRAQGFQDRVRLETGPEVVKGESNLLGYYSWGSNDPAIRERDLDLEFVPGALAAMFVSTDARTFREPPPEWTVGEWSQKAGYFAGSPQSLTGDLIRAGATGAAGHVAEPYLDGSVRPHILFPAYTAGLTLAEAFYAAIPYLSWQTVIVGDPLCAPFRRATPATEDLEAPIDPTTLLPRFFSERRVAVLAGPELPADAARQLLRADVLERRGGETTELRAALEEAIRLAPSQPGVLVRLAILDEAAGDIDAAVARYERVLELQEDNAIALNNLAYLRAVHQDRPDEALQLAERAVAVAPGQSSLLDTLAWIHHLRGDDQQAATYIDRALDGRASADIRIHAAAIYMAVGRASDARAQLDKALALDAALADRNDVKALTNALAEVP